MPVEHDSSPGSHTALRLWPGVVAACLIVLIKYILPTLSPDFFLAGVVAGFVGAIAIVGWWLFFSRAPWSERIGAIVVMVVAALAMSRLVHVSIAGGLMGMMYAIYAIPTIAIALVAWAVASRGLSTAPRRVAMVVAILIGSGMWTLLRTDGVFGGSGSQLSWRWTPTAEERLLAREQDEPAAVSPLAPGAASPMPTATTAVTATAAAPADESTDHSAEVARASSSVPAPHRPDVTAVATTRGNGDVTPPTAISASSESSSPITSVAPALITPASWPGFRGLHRDGSVRGVSIATDWSASPPRELWRRPIGPGWSSFAVSGDLLYTQEQRGDDELVSCYRVSTGEPVWRHRDPVRFWESNGGAGPRATPTLHDSRLYTFGATGVVNALDATTGTVLWSRNAATDTNTPVPDWGFASSPLVVDDVVIVAASGSMVGYDASTGQPRWLGPHHGGSYSSPHLTSIDGVAQVVILTGAGATSVAPATGELLWEHAWPGSTIVQPATLADGNILINTVASTGGLGTRRLAVTHAPGGWSVEERWTSSGLKPYFNDFVVHKGHAFGFDGSILASIDLATGVRAWKGGRYGNGQLVLLPDQDVLLVLSEEGALALVGATPDQFTELARFQALDAKTWNHPALVGDILLVRNGEEMAAFRLPYAGR